MAEPTNPLPTSPTAQPHDGAPGGPLFTEAELPISSVSGGGLPATLNGFSPDPSRQPLKEGA